MPDQKISQLTDGGNAQAADEFVVARSGSNFRIDGASVAAAATSVGTLTSLTVSGNANFDSGTLFVDSAANRVGVGTATPSTNFHVNNASGFAQVQIQSGGTNQNAFLNFVPSGTGTAIFQVGGSNLMSLDSSGNLAVDTNTLYVDAANNRVGVGTASPGNTLSVSGVAGVSGVSGGGATVPSTAHVSSSTLRLGLRGSVMTSDDAGLTTVGTYLCNNVFFKNASGNPAYLTTNPASAILLTDNVTIFRRAASGTADTDITFTESARIDASGNLGLGVTPATRLDVAQTNAKSATGVWQIQTFDTTSATTGVGGGISFGGYKTSTSAAEVFAAIDGYKENSTAGNAAGALRFHTQVSGGTGVVERARITSGGEFKVGETTLPDRRFSVQDNNTKSVVISADNTATQGTGWYLFYGTSDTNTTLQAWIRGDGTYGSRPNVYGGTSDAKLKQDIIDSSSQWDDIKAVRVRKFRFKDDPSQLVQIGVVAQELEQTSPGLVEDAPDYEEIEVTDEDGNVTTERKATGTVTKSVKYSILYMKSIKALQEAMARIEALEARLEALEA